MSPYVETHAAIATLARRLRRLSDATLADRQMRQLCYRPLGMEAVMLARFDHAALANETLRRHVMKETGNV